MLERKRFGVVSYEAIAVAFIGLMILFRSGSPFSIAYESLSGYIEIILSAILLMLYFGKKPAERNQRALIIVTVFALSLFMSMLFNSEIGSWKSYLINSLLCVDGYLVVSILGIERTKHYWIKWMRVVVVSALFIHFLIAFGVTGLPTVSTDNTLYYTIFIASEMIGGRLSGFCWEPSMYAVILGFSLLFELEENYKYKKTYFVLYIISLILTRSMSAYIYLILVIFIVYSRNIKSSSGRIALFTLTMILSGVLFANSDSILAYLNNLFPEIFNKLVNKDRSFLTRMYNPICDLLVFLENPIFGTGAEKVESAVRMKAILFSDGFINSRTSTCTYYFSAYGFLAGVMMNCIWIIGCLKNRNYDLLTKLAMLILCLYAFTSITLGGNQAFWILLFYLYYSAVNSYCIQENNNESINY